MCANTKANKNVIKKKTKKLFTKRDDCKQKLEICPQDINTLTFPPLSKN